MKISMKYVNKTYFSRIPLKYRNLNQKDGLILIKKALDKIILRYNALPSNFDSTEIDKLLKITQI
jgi:hypothetical protein